MKKDLTCNQVSALINFYIEGKLNPRLREYINLHIEKCPYCRKKISDLTKILNNFKLQDKNDKESQEESLNFDVINKLSAYIDNELNQSENIKIKKMTISNPSARKELESMYKFKKVVHSAYEKTKNDSKFDYSKDIMSQIQDNPDYTTTYFYKLAAIFFIIVSTIIGGFIYLYF